MFQSPGQHAKPQVTGARARVPVDTNPSHMPRFCLPACPKAPPITSSAAAVIPRFARSATWWRARGGRRV